MYSLASVPQVSVQGSECHILRRRVTPKVIGFEQCYFKDIYLLYKTIRPLVMVYCLSSSQPLHLPVYFYQKFKI